MAYSDAPAPVWRLEATIGRQLAVWSALSLIAGVLLWSVGDFWRGFALQALVWGGIDMAIAVFGQRSLRRKRRQDPVATARHAGEPKVLRRLLWINAGLDVLYVTAGVLVLVFLGDDAFARGNGWGVIVQGGFLLGFDAWHGQQAHRLVTAS
ncbi:MAG: hypothetical protein U5L04_00600 [Trueperaceae bacterium]|nr:hypothetical protein [Trueperaceae bacterium]